MSVFQDIQGLFNRVHIIEVRFSYTCTKSTKQQIEPNLTVDNDNVRKGRKRAQDRNAATIWYIFHDLPGPGPNP